jgi:hypothetical protein
MLIQESPRIIGKYRGNSSSYHWKNKQRKTRTTNNSILYQIIRRRMCDFRLRTLEG